MKIKTLLLGNNRGFAYLKTLIVILCILICFAPVTKLILGINNSLNTIITQVNNIIEEINIIEYKGIYEE